MCTSMDVEAPAGLCELRRGVEACSPQTWVVRLASLDASFEWSHGLLHVLQSHPCISSVSHHIALEPAQ